MSKQQLSTIGLLFITFLSAIQYVFLSNVPDDISTFSFLCITNLVGFAIAGILRFKKLITISKSTLAKGLLFAIELTGVNFFMILGSRNTDSVVISSVLSMYFIFITPILVMFKKKVNFFSGIASVLAIIALLLMFQADTDALFSSVNVIYLIISDIFFAAYVVSISIFAEEEDSTQLTLSQMLFATIFSLCGWGIETLIGTSTFSIPSGKEFWISVLFIGIFIRAIYGLLQIICQKHVPAINASLIFSSEIIITLVLNPVLCKIFGMTYTRATIYQIIGCIFFIIANLIVDDTVMAKLGFNDVELKSEIGEDGKEITKSSVSRKMIFTTLTFSMITLIVSTLICLGAIHFIRDTAVSNSTALGEDASQISESSLTQELEKELIQMVDDKAKLAESKLGSYAIAVNYAASYAETLHANPENFGDNEVLRADPANKGIWAMQRGLASESLSYEEDLLEESMLIGNMIDAFEPIITNNDNIATIYIGVENGLMVSFDPNSDDGALDSEIYYEFRESSWYNMAKDAGECIFTDPYYDSFGRGLTITCVAPFYDSNHKFLGCVAMDILVNDLNNSMVSDGVVDPNKATLIDDEGNIIAGLGLEEGSEEHVNIFDPANNSYLLPVGKEIIEQKDGITRVYTDNGEMYIAYATIDQNDWTLCVISPVESIIAPAVTIRENIDGNTQLVVDSVVSVILIVVQTLLIVIALMLITITFLVGKFSRKISDPLKNLEKDVLKISNGDFSQRTNVDTDDEIGNLARSFNFMTDSLEKYVDDLKEATAREEHIKSELSVATKIQADMLPNDFPAFPNRKDFDIYATMTPAKEVGGDFYDFFLIDDNHIGLVMADVSGKGVPAALFMVIAKTLIKNRTLMGGTPAEILTDVNNQLCEGNKENLFVTVWLAIIDLTTGKGLSANAGHECPALMRKDGEFELIKTRHGLALAAMEGINYKNNEFELFPGDRLYVYTDGVPEATDANNVLFGDERLIKGLNKRKDSSIEEVLHGMKADIDEFVGEAPQFDDVTMMCFDFKAKKEG